MASIEKRGTSYRITVSTGFNSNGDRLKVYTTFHPTAKTEKQQYKEAQDYANDFERQVKEGKYLSGEKITFKEFVDQWRENWAVDHLTQSQVEQYQTTLNNRVIPSLGHLKISKITPLRCQSLVKSWINDGLAPKTVRRDFSVMNSVFKFAYRMNIIQENPCDRCELPKIKRNNDLRYFTLDQAKRFLAAFDMTYTTTHKAHKRVLKETGETYYVPEYIETHTIPTQFKAYFYLAIYGGFRRGELLALTWKDIDFKEHTVSINKAIALTKEGMIIKSPKTEAGYRTVMLPDVCFYVLDEWKQKEKALRKSLGADWKGSKDKDFDQNHLFIQSDGSLMYSDTPYLRFKQILNMYNRQIEQEITAVNNDESLTEEQKKAQTEALKEQKLPNIRLHDLRHTSATLLLSEGADIETVSHRLGHSKASVTLDVYGHALETKDKSASEILNRLLG